MEGEETEEKKEEEKSEGEETPSEDNLVDKANQAAERLEAANKVNEELTKRQEKLAAQSALGGKSEAGQPTEPKLTPQEEASEKRIKEVGEATGAGWAKDVEKKKDGS